jgi:hypothetical protein
MKYLMRLFWNPIVHGITESSNIGSSTVIHTRSRMQEKTGMYTY